MISLGSKSHRGAPYRRIGLPGIQLGPNEFKTRIETPISKIQNLYLRVDYCDLDEDMAARISETMSAVWRDRERMKVQLQRRGYHGNTIQELSVTLAEKASSHQRLRLVFYGLAIVSEGGCDSWLSFVLQSALSQNLLADIPEDWVDGVCWLDVLLEL